jgi:hypothetical protein
MVRPLSSVIRGAALPLLATIASVTCHDSTGPNAGTPVQTVLVAPRIDSLFINDSIRLSATPYDSAGRPLVNRLVTWASSDTTRGRVSGSGLVIAKGYGSFAITATVGGVSGGAFLNVQQRVVSVALPDSFALGLDHRVRFVADVRGSGGGHLGSRRVLWSSGDTTVAIVDSVGTVSPRRLGATVIQVSSTGFSASTQLRIVPEPVATLVFTSFGTLHYGPPDTAAAEPMDSAGNDAIGNVIVWSSSDTTVLRVTPVAGNDRRAVLVALRVAPATLRIASTGKTVSQVLTPIVDATKFRFLQDSLILRVGGTHDFPGALWDTLGGFHDVGYLIHYSSTDPTIAYADTTGYPAMVRGLRVGRIRLTGATDGGWADTATIIVVPATTTLLTWAIAQGLKNYDTGSAQLAIDTAGGPLLGSHPISISSSDTTVMALSPTTMTLTSGIALIHLRGHRPGAALLTARIDSTFSNLFVVTGTMAPATVRITPRVTFLHVGDTLALTANVTGLDAIVRPYPVSWRSLDTTRLSVTATGQVVARATGATSLIARSDPVQDSLSVEVQSSTGIRIDSMTPSPWTPGMTVAINGSGFSPAPGATGVTVDGVSAVVTGATSNAVTLTVPPVTALACTPIHAAMIAVTSGGVLAADTVMLETGQPVVLALGQSVNLGDLQGQCRSLGIPNALYRATVTNAGAALTSLDFATVRDSLPRTDGSAPPLHSRSALVPSVGGRPWSLDSLRTIAARHQALLQSVREHARRWGPPGPLFAAHQTATPPRSPSVTVNGTALIRVPRIDTPDYCANYTSIQARLVYQSAHARIYEDITAPEAGTMDDKYQALAIEYDKADYPVLVGYFGDPLALDSQLDGSGRVTLVFSPAVNAFGSGAFVVDCDFYPEAVAPSSNTAEVIYGSVPTEAGTGFQGDTRDAWAWEMQSIIMHESEHLASLAARLGHSGWLEEPWLAEASANVAEEIWARSFYQGANWKSNASYRTTIYCDVRPTDPSCAGSPFAMFGTFALFYDYGQHHEQRTPLGPAVDPTDVSFIGSGWSFLRWATDQYAGSEGTFLRALTQEPTLTGLDNLTAQTGHPSAEMLADWFMAWTLADLGHVSTQRPVFNFPSWNLVDIYAGMASDFGGTFQGFPASPRCCHDNFYTAVSNDTIVNIPPGGSAYFLLQNTSASAQLLRLTSAADGALEAGMEIQLLRIR